MKLFEKAKKARAANVSDGGQAARREDFPTKKESDAPTTNTNTKGQNLFGEALHRGGSALKQGEVVTQNLLKELDDVPLLNMLAETTHQPKARIVLLLVTLAFVVVYRSAGTAGIRCVVLTALLTWYLTHVLLATQSGLFSQQYSHSKHLMHHGRTMIYNG
jgi:hypothetical protein